MPDSRESGQAAWSVLPILCLPAPLNATFVAPTRAEWCNTVRKSCGALWLGVEPGKYARPTYADGERLVEEHDTGGDTPVGSAGWS